MTNLHEYQENFFLKEKSLNFETFNPQKYQAIQYSKPPAISYTLKQSCATGCSYSVV